MVQPQEQPCSQAKGIQPIEVPNNDPQQLVMAYVHFHQIPIEHEERKEPQVTPL